MVVIIKNSKCNFNYEDIEEIASDVFFTVWKNQERLDINKKLAPYISGITRNLILKKQRKIKSSSVNIENLENSLYENMGINEQIEKNETLRIIMAELMQMKLEDRNIFIYYYYHSKGMREISEELNISEIKVKSRLFRIRKKLKKKLESRGYSYE